MISTSDLFLIYTFTIHSLISTDSAQKQDSTGVVTCLLYARATDQYLKRPMYRPFKNQVEILCIKQRHNTGTKLHK